MQWEDAHTKGCILPALFYRRIYACARNPLPVRTLAPVVFDTDSPRNEKTSHPTPPPPFTLPGTGVFALGQEDTATIPESTPKALKAGKAHRSARPNTPLLSICGHSARRKSLRGFAAIVPPPYPKRSIPSNKTERRCRKFPTASFGDKGRTNQPHLEWPQLLQIRQPFS